MSLRDLPALAVIQPGWAARPSVTQPVHGFGGLGRNPYTYTGAVCLASALALVLPGAEPSTDQTYAPLGLAVLIGWLLMVRLAPGQPGAALLVVPVMTLHARFGLAGVPVLAYTGVLASLTRGVRGARVVSTAGHATLAYALAHGLSQLTPIPDWIVFAIGFVALRFAFAQLAARFDASPLHARV